MPAVTALRPQGRDRVAVEVDDAPWRVLPTAAVLAAGLRPGLELDRARLRALARELRRLRAVGLAARALARRDHSRAALDRKLTRAQVPPAARQEALETLVRAGALDDARFAQGRAAALAGRGLGDAAIRYELERQGVGAEPIAAALATLEPEAKRLATILTERGVGPATARFVARRGFGEAAVEAAAGEVIAEAT